MEDVTIEDVLRAAKSWHTTPLFLFHQLLCAGMVANMSVSNPVHSDRRVEMVGPCLPLNALEIDPRLLSVRRSSSR